MPVNVVVICVMLGLGFLHCLVQVAQSKSLRPSHMSEIIWAWIWVFVVIALAVLLCVPHSTFAEPRCLESQAHSAHVYYQGDIGASHGKLRYFDAVCRCPPCRVRLHARVGHEYLLPPGCALELDHAHVLGDGSGDRVGDLHAFVHYLDLSGAMASPPCPPPGRPSWAENVSPDDT